MSPRAEPTEPAEAPLLVDTRTRLPQADYARLYALAEKTPGLTVGALVAECVRRQLHASPTGAPVVHPGKRRPISDADKERIRQLWGEGYYDSEISRAMNLGHDTVSRYRRSLGLPKRSPFGRRPLTDYVTRSQEDQ